MVLYGGQSSEHAVSCVTAAGVLEAFDTSRYEVIEVGITTEGQWTRPAIDPRTHSFASGKAPGVTPTGHSIQLIPARNGTPDGKAHLVEIGTNGAATELGPVDVILPLLHGPFGEDGTIQGLLELARVPYVGAGVLASAVGMDKHFMKLAFESAGLHVGPWVTVTRREWTTDPQEALNRAQSLRLPVFVKPARAGSSVGITRVDEWSQLDEAISTAQRHDPKVIIEQGIDGREIECGVLDTTDGSPAQASLLGEIVVDHQVEPTAFYDYTAKYSSDATTGLHCPADLPEAVSEDIRRQAVLAFEAVGSEGLSRVDFFYTTGGEIIINEINTMPGFTPISMFPQVWKATGLSFQELINQLIELALARPVGLR